MTESELLINMGERLRKQRKKMHLTQEQTAELLDISTSFYGEIERGKKRTSLEVILRIYSKMNLDITYFLTGKGMENSVFVDGFSGVSKEKQDLIYSILECLVELIKT